jgi:hypothetical protein
MQKGNQPLEIPAMTIMVGSFPVENAQSGKFDECSGRYESDFDGIRKRIKDGLKSAIAGDVPTVKSLIEDLRHVGGVTVT